MHNMPWNFKQKLWANLEVRSTFKTSVDESTMWAYFPWAMPCEMDVDKNGVPPMQRKTTPVWMSDIF